MQRVRPRRQLWLLFALVLALSAAMRGGVSDPAAAAPTGTPSGTPAASPASASKAPTVTFGIGPSDGKHLDGRADFGYQTSAGSTLSDHFAVVNISAQPLSLLVYGTDAVDSGGKLGYEPRGAAHTGASRWLALPEIGGSQIFRVKARSTVVLPFQVRVPRDATPGDHTAGIAVGLVADVTGNSTKNLQLEQRVVAKVYLRVAGAITAGLAVEQLRADYHDSLNPVGPGHATVRYTVHNTGNVDLGATQRVSLSGIFGGTGSVTQPRAIPDLLPGASATVTVQIAGAWPLLQLHGSVRVTPVALTNSVDGPLHAVSATTSVVAVPWALLGLLFLVVGGAFLGRRYLRRRAAARLAPSHRRSRGEHDPGLSERIAARRASATSVPSRNEGSDA